MAFDSSTFRPVRKAIVILYNDLFEKGEFVSDTSATNLGSDLPVKAMTIAYFYDIMACKISITVSYTIGTEHKRYDQIKFWDNDFNTEQIHTAVITAFQKTWEANGLSETEIEHMSRCLGKALKNTYQNNYEWNTHFGGSHNASMPMFQYFDNQLGHGNGAKVNGKSVKGLAGKLPGVMTTVDYPCDCGNTGTLYGVIMHLNDHENWSREKIADWVDELHDTGKINAEFQPWDETGMADEEAEFKQTTSLNSGGFVSKGWMHSKWSHCTIIDDSTGDTCHGMVEIPDVDNMPAHMYYTEDGNLVVHGKIPKQPTAAISFSLGPLSLGPLTGVVDALGGAASEASESMQGLNTILEITDEIKDFDGGENDNSNGGKG